MCGRFKTRAKKTKCHRSKANYSFLIYYSCVPNYRATCDVAQGQRVLVTDDNSAGMRSLRQQKIFQEGASKFDSVIELCAALCDLCIRL